MQRHGFEQVAVVAESVASEHVQIRRHPSRMLGDITVLQRDHEDLRQSECDSLAKLVRSSGRLVPERIHHMLFLGWLAGRKRGDHGIEIGLMRGTCGHRELLVEPYRISVCAQPGNRALIGTHRRLSEKARRFDLRCRDGHCGRFRPGIRIARAGAAGCEHQRHEADGDRISPSDCLLVFVTIRRTACSDGSFVRTTDVSHRFSP